MSEQPLDLKKTFKGVWQRRVLVGAVALVGLAGGGAYAVTHPQKPRAAALVLLPPSALTSTGAPERDLKTQVVVAESVPVLTPAAKSASPPMSESALKQLVTVNTLSQQVLQVEVSSTQAKDAITLANAVAKSYVNYVNHVLPGGSDGGPVEVLQPATSALPASKLHIPLTAGMGLGAGLLVGIVVAIVRSSRDRRLRYRDEIAGALGIPVLASLDAKSCSSVSHWRKLLDDYTPSPATRWSLRRTLHRLAPGGAEMTQAVRVIAFADDKPALAAGAQLAMVAASLGTSTVLVPGDAEALVSLRAACAVQDKAGRRPGLHTSPMPDSALDRAGPGPDRVGLTVSLAAVDRSKPALWAFAGANVLSVSSGFATADDLARLALAAAEAAQAVDGIFVVNPEPRDGTSGSPAIAEISPRLAHRVSHSSGGEPTAGLSR